MSKLIETRSKYLTKEQIEQIREMNEEAVSILPLGFRGFTKIPHFITRSRGLISSQAFHLYSILNSYAYQGYHCFPTLETLKTDMGVKTSTTILKYLDELEDWGLITKYKSKNKFNNVYAINIFKNTRLYIEMKQLLTADEITDIENEDCMAEDFLKDLFGEDFDICDMPTKVQDAGPSKEIDGTLYSNGRSLSKRVETNKQQENKKNCDKKNDVKTESNQLTSNTLDMVNKPEPISNKLFDTSKSEIKHLESKLNALDKNKYRLQCAQLRFKIAKLKKDYTDITCRDIAYYFKHDLYLERYGHEMVANNYFTGDLNKFFKRYGIANDEYLEVMEYLLKEYDYHKDERYPKITQGMFGQGWLMDKLMLGYRAQKEQDKKGEEMAKLLADGEKIRQQYIDDEIKAGRDPVLVF